MAILDDLTLDQKQIVYINMMMEDRSFGSDWGNPPTDAFRDEMRAILKEMTVEELDKEVSPYINYLSNPDEVQVVSDFIDLVELATI